jgi:integrase
VAPPYRVAIGTTPGAVDRACGGAPKGDRRVHRQLDALSGLRIRDLRHSFASFAIADGASLFLVGKLLGHASSRTTERYAHLSGDPLQKAVTSIGRAIVGPE